MNKYQLKLKRAYEKPEKSDGFRVLIDRLWPRGVSKEKAKVDLWLKEIAPSSKLRKWFGHDPEKWAEFQKKYRKELMEKRGGIESLKNIISKKKITTLIYSASDEKHNNAVALKKILRL
ncbi:MAG: DUF488 domain-containing protein [Candidatus Moranbacteria bacterium]|nr:DUF488 domain-containing protein [Candidatus Moranbacteria bacterium]